jgi:predicted enzyme related to lactoylglutathione lyase
MKKTILIIAALTISFGFGYAFNSIISPKAIAAPKKVTGIGGIFFKCKEPKKVKQWYKDHLGLNAGDYGVTFQFYQGADSTKKGYLQWGTFSEKTKYFNPSTKDFMINYRVENLDALIAEFKRDSITITDTVESASYGKFIHIMDIEGNKVELWEPNDVEYSKIPGPVTK